MKYKFHVIALALVIFIIPLNIAVAENDLSENYEYAVVLNQLGLFLGTDISFELEREPTRLEGAVMFIRLLGKEEEALLENYPHPFNDVPQWGAPYVGYLYENGLTNGISEDKYGSYLSMRAISYLTFALRALGYSDEGSTKDFSWEEAIVFAYNNSIIDLDLYFELITETFLRGHVTRVSYDVLKAETKFSGNTLIEKLVIEGTVSRDAAVDAGLLTSLELSKTKVLIGHTFNHALNLLGTWDRNQFSRYGFDWFIYDSDYSNYIQIGIENDLVTGILAASYGYSYERNISIGMTRTDMESVYTEGPLDELRKPLPGENTIVIFDLNDENKSTYMTAEGDYITYYFDSYDDNIIRSILIVDAKVEERTIENFPPDTDDLFFKSLEIQTFCLTNAYRVQKGLDVLVWDEPAEKAASLHSRDMAEREYFSHYTLEGVSLGSRLSAQGINYNSAGENIAYGYRNPIHMVNDWLNSKTGHREILLGDFDYLGVGIWIDDDGRMYGTQDYWR